ncbi:lysophospholipid acyltransferase family protein [Mycoplasmopsis gallopavonis]|uniref:1-acyl-sn-glycerol-3-phosphate acyltransferase n=1 Tax=Mycoplasmopsis gallopavonis TaxID=76629 RepID=A0A449AZ56_9BACT|nr:lysophospholipid acyltransferase family protein [Mycoplasmopsis gallopavonis]RIV16978.1 1-acyl-sn-glycerol-3-phosphate acyltransferase [Mycoplasmopsis gallopavonis]VEU72772.1 1-acyl-sn-glycerol-3-phosphate acyltransferase [Mycoplasmopsis gallopavonis]
MKKFAFNITLKKILFALPWIHRARKLWSMSRKYKRTPEMVSLNERYSYLLKLSKKIIKMHNVNYVIKGLDNLPNNGGVLLTPNHKSNIDALLIIAALEKQTEALGDSHKFPTFVAKKELEKKRVLKHALKLLDTVSIDRANFRESLAKVLEFGEYLKKEKRYGVIFPEGTRVQGDDLGEFKAGAFKTAQKNYLNIIPVAIINSEQALNSKRRGRIKVIVSFLKPIKASTIIGQDAKALGEKVRKSIIDEIKKYDKE